MGRVIGRAFWGPRPQSVEDGVEAIFQTLIGLRELDEDHYGRWFDPGMSRRDARLREIAIDRESLRSWISQNSESGPVIDELGWSLFAHNGADDDDEVLGFSCNFAVTSKWVKNSVVFDMPSEWEYDLGSARQALDLVVRVWRPEMANVWNAENVDLVVADI